MEFNKVLENRFSVRDFSSAPVEDEKIEAILDAIKFAPTAKNTQCQEVYVLKSKEAIEKIRSITNNAFNAPLVFITCANLDRECHLKYPVRSFKETDVSIIQTYMMLKASDLGLDSCWVCRFLPEEVQKAFNMPENIVPLNLLLVGYKAEGVEPNPRHFDRLNKEDFVKIV